MKTIIALISIPLIIEAGILYGLNNFVFVDSSEFVSQKIESTKNYEENINMAIPKDSEDIIISHEGKYFTYSEKDAVYMGSTQTGKINKIKVDNNASIIYYKWIDNRDILALIEKVKEDGSEKIKLVTYNADNSAEKSVSEICSYKQGIKIKDVTMSVLTGVYYINVDNGKDAVYRIDRNDKLSKVSTKENSLSSIKTMEHVDRLLYEGQESKDIFITSPDEKLSLSEKMSLLGVDKNDVVYVGKIENDKLSSIAYGNIDSNINSWKSIKIDADVNADMKTIYFNKESQILVNDTHDNKVKNLTTGDEIEYKGKLIQIEDNFIAVMDDEGKLVYKHFK